MRRFHLDLQILVSSIITFYRKFTKSQILLDPPGTNTSVRRRIVLESALLIPRPALRDFRSLAFLDNSAGTRHRCEPLRQPVPKEER